MLLKLIVVFHARKSKEKPQLHPSDLRLALNVELRDRFRIDKYRKDALLLLTEYTRNAKYRRLAELLMLLSTSQETLNKFNLSKLFFQYLINRISMSNLLQKVLERLR